jgi:hypothetical protein
MTKTFDRVEIGQNFLNWIKLTPSLKVKNLKLSCQDQKQGKGVPLTHCSQLHMEVLAKSVMK